MATDKELALATIRDYATDFVEWYDREDDELSRKRLHEMLASRELTKIELLHAFQEGLDEVWEFGAGDEVLLRTASDVWGDTFDRDARS